MTNVYLPSTWKRFVANGLDEMIMIPFYAPFFGIFFTMFTSEEGVSIPVFTFLLILLVPAVYEFVFLVLMQATPAKWLLGLKVVPVHNFEEPLSWQAALLRALAKRLSLFFSLAIYVVALFRYDRTHAVDWIADTRVVQNVPRNKPAKIRWIIGSVFVIYFCIEGWSAATKVIKTIDWQNNQVHLDELLAAYNLEDLEGLEIE